MKRLALVLTLVAGAFGSLLIVPIAHAQDWCDINRDARAIRQTHRNIRHDQHELWEDVENGDWRAAAHERAEIAQRRAYLRYRQHDLNSDLQARYYGHRYYYGYDD